ncbi:cyclic di-GMP phosphodiesterase [Escherichia coli]|uniref:Cyclic di-GMP phosphodiesterase n=1 Tax=Escherichia coli TaxID=562 RepID=A0A376UDF8_ECOLX|nr:cyclic di-GMP phosphodiesterase [Escherichia coli]
MRIIFDLARYNRIPVIAEGVESEDVARELIKLGCVQAQGYLYQKPMPFSAWDKSGKISKRVVYVCPESISSYLQSVC